MLKYWDDSPRTKGKRNKEWSNTIVLSGPKKQSYSLLTKIESDEDWVCQILIQHVNDKSPVIQEEMEYALCWSPIVKKKKKNPKLIIGIYSPPFPDPQAPEPSMLPHFPLPALPPLPPFNLLLLPFLPEIPPSHDFRRT
jgi:hypothetical protein